jgi:hypothetical protein
MSEHGTLALEGLRSRDVVALAVTAPSLPGSRLEWVKTPFAASLSPDG